MRKNNTPVKEPSTDRTAMLNVYDGRDCVGIIFCRGRAGVEAFSAADISLGLFESESEAAAEIWRHHHHQRRL
jgi:hypothetical protein